uniref:Uncharacterized protein n=1 Tax=Anguilla anguilla TaxID=7936 RepID=A0A0E9S0E9_ANGAN
MPSEAASLKLKSNATQCFLNLFQVYFFLTFFNPVNLFLSSFSVC